MGGWDSSPGWRERIFERYDAVLHLVTAADGAEAFYKNTTYRFENMEQARELDRKVQDAWKGHPHHKIFPNHGTFEDKMTAVVGSICELVAGLVPDAGRKPAPSSGTGETGKVTRRRMVPATLQRLLREI